MKIFLVIVIVLVIVTKISLDERSVMPPTEDNEDFLCDERDEIWELEEG